MPHLEPSSSPYQGIAGEQTRTFRVAGEFRRCLVYITVGGLIVLMLLPLVPRPAPQPIQLEELIIVGLVAVALPLLAWLYTTTWRLRIDEAGLWRRRLGAWSCWDWETIAGGQVRWSGKYGILWNSRGPWWDKAIGVGLLGRDGNFVCEVLQRVLPEKSSGGDAAHEPAPGEAAIRTWFPFQWIRIRTGGIEVERSGKSANYPWDAVERVRLVRCPQGEFLVHALELDLRDAKPVRGSLTSVQIDKQPVRRLHVRGATWARRLQAIVPAPKWQCFDMTGKLHSAEEARYRIEFWRKRQWPLRVIPWLGIALLPLIGMRFVPGMWAIWNVPFPIVWKILAIVAALLTMVMPPVLLFLVSGYVRAQMKEHARDAEKQLQGLLESQSTDQPIPNPTDFRRMFQVQGSKLG